MEDYLTFRKMITPVVIQVLFWVAAAVTIIVGLVTLTQNLIGGLLVIVFGPILVRVYAEIFMVLFQMNAALQDLREQQRTRTPPAPAP